MDALYFLWSFIFNIIILSICHIFSHVYWLYISYNFSLIENKDRILLFWKYKFLLIQNLYKLLILTIQFIRRLRFCLIDSFKKKSIE